jgi:ubiquinone/menaquinone biosynthesis C-methylase UbiE
MLGTHFPSNFFNTVICCEGYEHVGRRAQFLLMDEIYRIAKPDGVVLLTTPIAEKRGDWSGNEFHLYEPTIAEVEETFVDKFEVVKMTKPNVARYRLRTIK